MKDNYSKLLKHLHLPQHFFVTCKYTVVVPYNYTFRIDPVGSKRTSRHCRRLRAAGDLLGAQTGPDSLHYCNTKEMRRHLLGKKAGREY